MTNKKKRILGNIAFYTALVFVYGIVAVAIVSKVNHDTLSIFGNRMEVILTDSMSEKNENHLEFLEGTTQIKPFDITLSSTVNENTELKVKDVVVFRNPDLHNQITTHRIDNITEEGIGFKITNCDKREFAGKELTYLDGMTGKIELETLDLSSIEIIAYSPSQYSKYYILGMSGTYYDFNVDTQYVETGVYKHILTYSRATKTPYQISILPANLDYQYIESIKYTSFSKGDLLYNSSELVVGEDNSYFKNFFPYYLYQTRGDKAKTADTSLLKKEDIIARVHTTIPKLGIMVRFMQSVPGIITFIGLGLIITLASFFWTKNEKKKEANALASGLTIDAPVEEKVDESAPTKENNEKEASSSSEESADKKDNNPE